MSALRAGRALLVGCLAVLSATTSATPLDKVNGARQAAAPPSTTVTVTATSIVTETITDTVQANPTDSTVSYIFGTFSEYPYTTTLWNLAGCVSYTYTGYDLKPSQVPTNPTIIPPTTTPTFTSTIIATATVTRTTTTHVTEKIINTDVAPTTSYVYGVYVTQTTPYTSQLSICTNTVVQSAWLRAVEHRTTTTGLQGYTRATVTAACVTTLTRAATVPGLDYDQVVYQSLPDYESFTAGTTRITALQASEYYDTTTFTAATATITETVCNNPTTEYTSWYYTTTSTRTSTVTETKCPAPAAQVDSAAVTSAPEAAAKEQGAETTVLTGEVGINAGKLETVAFTTVVQLKPSIISTFTGTATIETVTPTLTTVFMRGSTIYVDTTKTTTVCATKAA